MQHQAGKLSGSSECFSNKCRKRVTGQKTNISSDQKVNLFLRRNTDSWSSASWASVGTSSHRSWVFTAGSYGLHCANGPVIQEDQLLLGRGPKRPSVVVIGPTTRGKSPRPTAHIRPPWLHPTPRQVCSCLWTPQPTFQVSPDS